MTYVYNEVQTVEYETAQMLWREGTSFSSPLLLCKRLYALFLSVQRSALALFMLASRQLSSPRRWRTFVRWLWVR